MKKIIEKIIKNLFVPSKFYGGISILWRGCSFELCSNISIFKTLKSSQPKKRKIAVKSDLFLFNSGRSAIVAALRAQGLSRSDKVIISSFTCDALPFAISQVGSSAIYVDVNEDLTMNEADVRSTLDSKPKAIIVQNTLGRLGLREEFIQELIERDIFVLVDNSLSYGSEVNGRCLSTFGHASVWTFECSKTITIGGGGALQINYSSLLPKINEVYKNIPQVGFLEDLRRYIHLRLSLALMKHPSLFGPFIWTILRLIGVFKPSSSQNKVLSGSILRLGKLGHRLYEEVHKEKDKIFDKTNDNIKFYEDLFRTLNVITPIQSRKEEKIVSPRFCVFAKEGQINNLMQECLTEKLEVGRWFEIAPPTLKECIVSGISNNKAQIFSANIVNFPAYWTLSELEKNTISKIILKLASKNLFDVAPKEFC